MTLTTGEQLLFVLLFAMLGGLGAWRLVRVARVIAAGRRDPRRVAPGRALLDVLTQRAVVRGRPAVGVLHAPLVFGFLLYLVTNPVEVIGGFHPLVLGGPAWRVYRAAVDLLSVAILAGMAALLLRRFVLGSRWMSFGAGVRVAPGLRRRVNRDSAIVGIFIIVHVGARMSLAALGLAQSAADPFQPAASALAVVLTSLPPRVLGWGAHAAWWLAFGSILLFWPYFAGSKHLHLLAAPVKLAVRRDHPAALDPVDLDAPQPLGASRLEEMAWPRLLDAAACIQCLRCQAACPVHAVDGVLSPAAILISERVELDRVAARRTAASRLLLECALTEEAAWACTTCGACIEACPVGAEPMLHIMDVRRHLAMEAATVPRSVQQTFDRLLDLGHPFKGATVSRTAWMRGLDLPHAGDGGVDFLYWVGCAAAFEPRAQEVARALVRVLHTAGLRVGVLGADERCCGDPARRLGHEYVFQTLVRDNVDRLRRYGVRRIVTACAHCYHTLKFEYPAWGGVFEVLHHTQLIARLYREGRLPAREGAAGTVTVHDACYLARHSGEVRAPRAVLGAVGAAITEMPRSGRRGFCCGAGGGRYWTGDGAEQRPSEVRMQEAERTGAPTVATACPYCLLMLEDAVRATGASARPQDVAEIVAAALVG